MNTFTTWSFGLWYEFSPPWKSHVS